MPDFDPSTIDVLRLPSLPYQERRALPTGAAVYFVLEGRTVLYIGQTVALRQRWRSHQLTSLLRASKGHRIAWWELPDSMHRCIVETACCRYWRPRYNKALLPKTPTYKNLSVTLSLPVVQVITHLATEAHITVAEQMRALLLEALEARNMLILHP